MVDSYCGIGKVPKKKKRGSMKECAEKGQIRYYGIKKIDKKLAENAVRVKKIDKIPASKVNKQIEKMTIEYATLLGKIRGTKKKLESEKDKTKKEKLKNEIGKLKEKSKKVGSDLSKLKNKK